MLYVAFRVELKDWCILKETKQTSVNNEPISFSLEVSGIQILCELKCCFVSHNGDMVELADLTVLCLGSVVLALIKLS